MKKPVITFLIIGVFIVLLSISYYFSQPYINGFNAFLSRTLFSDKHTLEGINFTIINNSKLARVAVNDQKKLEQLIRRYNVLFQTYKSLELTIEDSAQDINFGWGNGNAFGYSISPLPSSTLQISLMINTPLIENYQWSITDIETETESIFLNSLERASLNLDISKADTHSEAEEQEKSALIEESSLKAFEELNLDNQNQLFRIEIL